MYDPYNAISHNVQYIFPITISHNVEKYFSELPKNQPFVFPKMHLYLHKKINNKANVEKCTKNLIKQRFTTIP